MTPARTGLIVLALVFASCKVQRIAGPQDAGPVCEENERLVAGVCRFVCQRDGDCDEGFRCNLFVGTCELKAPPVDAGPPPIPCTTGADRCTADGKAVETCTNNTWAVSQTCPVGGFCKNEKCLACQPGLTNCVVPDGGQPDGGTASTEISICKDDGSGFRAVICNGTATCTQGECRDCTPGSTRCSADSKSLQTCTKQNDETLTWKWSNTGDNLDGTCITQVCQLSGTGMPECKPPTCIPGMTSCKNTTTQQVCGPTGSFNDVSCQFYPDGGADPAGECQNSVCVHECEQAVAAKSYFGCDYWTTVMDNGFTTAGFKAGTASGQGTSNSEFAFVVTNRSTLPTIVTVTRVVGGNVQTVSTTTVQGKNDVATKGLATIRVPWQSIGPDTEFSGVSGLLRYGYRIESTRPITVYQFNPLSGTGVGGVFSYTNDASLLLPAHILGTSYVAMGGEGVVQRPTTTGTANIAFNGTVSIVGTQPNTVVTVRASARMRAGVGVAAMSKGEIRNFTLQPYDVLQLSTDVPSPATNISCGDDPFGDTSLACVLLGQCRQFCRVADGDITGTIVTSDKPVSAFGGAYCATRSYLDVACDHLEEQLFPFVTWGKKFVAPRTAPLRLINQQFANATNAGADYYKILAGCPDSQCPNGTLITLSGAIPAGDILANPGNGCDGATSLTANNCRLRGGKFIEFRSKSSFTITSDQPISVGQFFASTSATGGSACNSATPPATCPEQGDPSFVLLPPIEQWRANYTVLSAASIKDNYLGLVIDDTKVMSVQIDGNPVPPGNWVTVAGSAYKIANVPVAAGTHTIDVTPKPMVTPLPGAGVTVYGFDRYVSYGYTGGLDLTTIVSGINPGG